MKKVLVSLLVLALAVTGAFAAVNFSGQFTAGFTFNYDNGWKNVWFGDDNVSSMPLKLNAKLADEDGIWSISMKDAMIADGRLNGTATIDLGKLFFSDSDFSLSLAMIARNRSAALNAYNNVSGLNISRIRTNEGYLAELSLGYGKLVQVKAGAGFTDAGKKDGTTTTFTAVVSAMTTPMDGLSVSVGYVYGGQARTLHSKAIGDKDVSAINAAANVNVGQLADLDFDLGVSAAYKYNLTNNINMVAAAVYGGIDAVSFKAEYGLAIASASTTHTIYVGADLGFVENLKLNVYAGAFDLAKFAESFYVGGNVGYDLTSSISVNANVQYSTTADIGVYGGEISEGGIKAKGLAITPYIQITW